jgi:serine/threonine protein kinase
MSQPSFAEYTDALRLDLAAVLSDPLLARGQLLMRGPGLPTVYGGNFALTFVVEVDDRRYAVRCFHKPTDGLQQRYEAIGHHLRSIASPYFVEFEFQPSGITTESGAHPVVRMDWADGPTLGAFVAEHRGDASTLQQLRDSVRRLAANLDVCGIAHGDIQPSNIIVESPTQLKLIDYDGMFVPALRSMASAEIGQRNFQHPGRRECHFDAGLDAFSFAVLDVALDALSKRPDLWEATDSGEDAFIFHSQDFADPARSPTFRALVQLPRLEQRVRNLASVCASPFERIPSFGDFLAGRNIPEVAVVFSGDPILTMPRRYLSPHPVVDAANFARCCSHVGDRVELIGRVFRVARSHTARFEATYLRVEFGERGQDMSCLKIWPDAESRLDDVPEAAWVGQWVSAVGLVEPVARGHSGAQRQRDVSISINERSQLQRITEAEARLRLRGRDARTRPAPDGAEGIRTDPVMTDRAPRLKVVTTRRPHGGTRPALVRTRRGASPEPATADVVPAEAPALPDPRSGPSPSRHAGSCRRGSCRPASRLPEDARRRLADSSTGPGATATSHGLVRGHGHRRSSSYRVSRHAVAARPCDGHRSRQQDRYRPKPRSSARADVAGAHGVPLTDELAVQLELQQSLRGARLPIETRAGSLSIGAAPTNPANKS